MATATQLRTAQRNYDRAVTKRKAAETALNLAKQSETAAQAALDALAHPVAPSPVPIPQPAPASVPAVSVVVPAMDWDFANNGLGIWRQTQVWDVQLDADPRGWIRRCQNEWHPANRLMQPSEIGTQGQHLQIYVGGMSAMGIPEPVSASPDGVRITARRNADQFADKLWGWTGRWTSGLLTLSGIFEQRLGYWETRMRWSGGWPSFWGVPSTANGGQELDFLEGVNGKPGLICTSAHGTKGGAYSNAGPALASIKPGDWVTIGGEWTNDFLIQKIGGVEVGRVPLLGLNMDRPIYPILALEIGSGRGWPDQTEPAGDVWVEYDYVRVWR